MDLFLKSYTLNSKLLIFTQINSPILIIADDSDAGEFLHIRLVWLEIEKQKNIFLDDRKRELLVLIFLKYER